MKLERIGSREAGRVMVHDANGWNASWFIALLFRPKLYTAVCNSDIYVVTKAEKVSDHKLMPNSTPTTCKNCNRIAGRL